MYLNVQIIQCVSFHFIFVNSFRNSTVINDDYWKTLVQRGGSFVSKKYKNHNKFNDMPELTWISTCKYVTKELRNNYGYGDVYVDYRATSTYTGNRCNEILVWVPRIPGNVKQIACYCFVRPSILALDIPQEHNQYNRKIMIYPTNTHTLILFEENRNQGNFYPLEIYDKKAWAGYIPADLKISTTPLPQSYGQVSNLKIILDPIFDNLTLYSREHLNTVKRSDGFFTLCRIVLQRTRYFGMITLTFKHRIPAKGKRVSVVLRRGSGKPKVATTWAHDCSEFIPNSETVITNYKIATGPNRDTLLVLRETNCPKEIINNKNYFREFGCYEIVELIEYLSVQYMSIYH